MKQYGYTLLPPNPDEHNVYFAKLLQNKIPLPILPSGYKIRKLQESDDLESYGTLYGFSKVDPLHQKELIESNEYCHLVVVNPDDEWERTNQWIGWIDYVETKPDQQKKGLGQAILMAGLLQLQELGAETDMRITVNTNIPGMGRVKRVDLQGLDWHRTVYIIRHVGHPFTRAQALFWEFARGQRGKLNTKIWDSLVSFATNI